jgi:hypothetical protein
LVHIKHRTQYINRCEKRQHQQKNFAKGRH